MAHQLEDLKTALADRYAIKHDLGSGATSTIYLAEDLKHHRQVALKVLNPELVATMGAERFLREIKIVAGLTHPHILPLYDSGEIGGFLYYVMPYVEGESLRDRLTREKQLSVKDAVQIAREVADALGSAHTRNIVHRDIKPGNILLEEGHAVVADFGIARAICAAGATHVTETGLAVGTPVYMSPEQASGESDIDERSDLYSLACVLYEMLAGNPPFVGPNARAIIARHLMDPVPPLTTVRPDIPANVVTAITKALSKEPVDRFPTVTDFADALVAEAPEGDESTARSIAVLPFDNMSASAENEYLSDGITEEIINALAKIGGLAVVSRTSAFAYKGKKLDVRTIGEQLNVACVLEGSVRKSGDRLRITAQLVSVADGYHLWSERYDREMADVFAIQDEIAENIARALRVILSEDEKRAIAKVPPADVEAYEYYLRGRQFFHTNLKRSLRFAREMFTRAIEIDPDYALAWAGIADCSSLLRMYYPASESSLEQADAASSKALELDPNLPEAHAARGFALWQMQRDEEAKHEFETAIELDPQQFEARYFYARQCFTQGDLEKAARLFEEASSVRADYPAAFFAAQSHAALGREAEARAAYRRALEVVGHHLELNPDDPRAATMRAVSLCRLGQRQEGLEWAERAIAIDPEDAGVCYNVACLYALEGQTEKAIDKLECAIQVGFGARNWIANDPDLDSLRDHPRFRALLEGL
ncbi:MAG: protein kinase [Gemmatimonadota bacterium]|jgi:serine/threonine protein kinase/Flp pilus assembly protein TadD